MKEKYEYLVQISLNLYEFESFEIIPTVLGYGSLKTSKEEIVVPCDFSSSCDSSTNQVASCTEVEVGE